MHKETSCEAISVNPGERLAGCFRIVEYPPDKKGKEQNQRSATKEPEFLTHSAENEIRTLLRHKAVGSLSPLKETLAAEAPGANRNH